MILCSFYVTLPFFNNACTNDIIIKHTMYDRVYVMNICTLRLALFPDLPSLQFLMACSMQKLEVGRSGIDWEQGYIEAACYFNRADGD